MINSFNFADDDPIMVMKFIQLQPEKLKFIE